MNKANNYEFTPEEKEKMKDKLTYLMNEKERLLKTKDKILADKLKLEEISKKDVLDLTEEEIVLLAHSRVHGDRSFTSESGVKVRKMGTTFEYEYKKITDLIEEKRNVSKR